MSPPYNRLEKGIAGLIKIIKKVTSMVIAFWK